MLNCEQVTRLVSESFDRNLTLRERLGLRLHTMMCGTCRLFRQLQHRIHEAIVTCNSRSEGSPETVPGLQKESIIRLKSAVQKAVGKQDSD